MKGINKDNNIISIDLSVWTTQTALAKKLDVKVNTINARLARGADCIFIPELGVRLVPNIDKISDLKTISKKIKKNTGKNLQN